LRLLLALVGRMVDKIVPYIMKNKGGFNMDRYTILRYTGFIAQLILIFSLIIWKVINALGRKKCSKVVLASVVAILRNKARDYIGFNVSTVLQ